MQNQHIAKKVILVGNPNVGKSTIFNLLCNRKQKTGNYAGVTVASLKGEYRYKNEIVEVTDLPGAYSIYPSSEDEAVFSKYLIEEQNHYTGIVYILEATSMKRGLLLLQQIQDFGAPIMVVINQIDQAEKKGISINTQKLEQELGVPVFKMDAKKQIGIEPLREGIKNNVFKTAKVPFFRTPIEQKTLVNKIQTQFTETNEYKAWLLLASESYLGKIKTIQEELRQKDTICPVPKRLQVQETIRRYEMIDRITSQTITQPSRIQNLLTERLDRILVHPIWGYLIFLALLLLIFQSVFFLAEYPMTWIEDGFSYLSEFTHNHLPKGPINDLVSNGIIPGVGGIMVFAPQIGILLYFLYLLEDSGYMARVVFLMDRILRPFGLNGKSIVPLVSGTACAIPAIMSTRNIENIKERLITILVTPFMTCSARLPIYSIIITLVIPQRYILGIDYRAIALMGMYFLGFAMALAASWVLKNIIKTQEKSFLVMDLPTYKTPLFGYDFRLVLGRVWEFITQTGRVIFAVSILLWALSYIGPSENGQGNISIDVPLEQSYLAKIGHAIEPTIQPLGYDWKMGVGILTSFAAREVFVGTLSTLYSLDDDASEEKVIDKMRKDKKPDGTLVFSFATGISILMFYAFAMQCISTIAVVYRETKSFRWTAIQLVGMSGLAYIASFVVYQLLKNY